MPAQVPTPVIVRGTEATPAVTAVIAIPGEHVLPPHVRVILLALVFEVPVFITVIEPVGPAASAPCTSAVLIVETLAVLVNDPKRPKTNPAIAMAAMRVIAMRITVAKTGLIAFLRLALLICIVCYLSTRMSLRMGPVRRWRGPGCLRRLRLRRSLHHMFLHLSLRRSLLLLPPLPQPERRR